ncbi:hypothetical protein HN385_07265 [archaeon]|jgi:hypothetical protein|nr:hypothetical protein [archaeon]
MTCKFYKFGKCTKEEASYKENGVCYVSFGSLKEKNCDGYKKKKKEKI